MSCPRCSAPANDETLREFGGVCPKCLLDFSEEQDAPAFPNLEIVEMLGQGGMGVVYKAVQRNLGRTVALKVLSPQLSDDPEFVERFTREARALASLSHPNIVGIYDSGIHDHVPYLVMEYVDGTPLRKMIALKKLAPERVLEVIPQICYALHYAHAHGVVHRDIKPENILVDREGRVKIADFGLAKLASLEETRITRTGLVMGSPHYMAPEQIEHSGRVDHRADIYSLGVVFYEMLTGELPIGRFKPPSARSTSDQRLDPVVLKSLEREPDDRWQSADEVKRRVTRLEDAPPPDPAGDRRFKFVIAGVGAIAVVAVGVVFWFLSDRKADYVGGPILVIVAGVVTLAGMSGRLRGSRWKPIEPPTEGRRQAMIVGIAAAALVFIAIAVLLFVTAHAPAPPALAVPIPPMMAGEADRFYLNDAWSLAFRDSLQGEEVFRAPHPHPDGGADISLVKNGQWQQMMEDVAAIRRAPWDEGRLLLYGIQFKSEEARRRWEKHLNFETATFGGGQVPKGLSLFKVGFAQREPSARTVAAKDGLMIILRGQMEAAAEKIRR